MNGNAFACDMFVHGRLNGFFPVAAILPAGGGAAGRSTARAWICSSFMPAWISSRSAFVVPWRPGAARATVRRFVKIGAGRLACPIGTEIEVHDRFKIDRGVWFGIVFRLRLFFFVQVRLLSRNRVK